MTKLDPIIAVEDAETSSKWYQSLFGFKSKHGGKEFDILVNKNDEVTLCLHKWGEHEHPTMKNSVIKPGNGLILYFRTENMRLIRQNAKEINALIEKDIHLNPNSKKDEFPLRDPNGYYLTITELHEYEG